MTLSAAPVANHSLPGSTVTQRTQPMWPEMTLYSFQGACHAGLGMLGAFLMAICVLDCAPAPAPPPDTARAEVTVLPVPPSLAAPAIMSGAW